MEAENACEDTKDSLISPATSAKQVMSVKIHLTDVINTVDGLICVIFWIEHESFADLDNGVGFFKMDEGRYFCLRAPKTNESLLFLHAYTIAIRPECMAHGERVVVRESLSPDQLHVDDQALGDIPIILKKCPLADFRLWGWGLIYVAPHLSA